MAHRDDDGRTRRFACATLALLAGIAVAGCEPRHRHDRRYYYEQEPYERAYERRGEREMDFDDAWDVVRRDPCRYDEYRRFTEHHKNPERRREAVWRLAREGCSRGRAHEYDYR